MRWVLDLIWRPTDQADLRFRQIITAAFVGGYRFV